MKTEILNGYEYTVAPDNGSKAEITKIDSERLRFDLEWKKNDGTVTVSFKIPCIDIECMWEPTCIMNRNYNLHSFSTSLMGAIPLVSYCNNRGNSVYTIAASETVKKLDYSFNINEYTAEIDCKISVNLRQFAESGAYSFVLYIQTEELPLWRACKNVSAWWEEILEIKESKLFDEIALPGYNTWYSYHHDFTEKQLLEECRTARELGMRVFILDSGWQNNDPIEGSRYSGDWETASEKIPDMKAFADKVHEMGMKLIIWFSFSFIGFDTELWRVYGDKIIHTYNDVGTGILDPRYPEVRNTLAQKYVRAVKEWGVDGFKFDFIDAFRNYKDYVQREGMDYAAVEDAVEAFLTEVTEQVRRIKPNAVIECRQGYTGPYIRHYANYLGPIDSPDYYRQNRVGTIDLRMTSGRTLVYSDMLMWNSSEPVEKAALQIENVIFTLLHISVRLNELSAEHRKMLKFWLDFSVKNRELLLHGDFKPLEMQSFYPVVSSENEQEAITAVYAVNKVVDIDVSKKNTIINACDSEEVVMRLSTGGELCCTALDCMGNTVEKFTLRTKGGITSVRVPASGLLIIEEQ